MKKSIRSFVASSLILLTLPLSALAGSPVEDQLSDDKLVATALDDIGKMGQEEIENLISFHVSCSMTERTDANKSSCEKEQNIYQIKYSRGRSIDMILYSLVAFREYIGLPKNQRLSDQSEREEMSKMIKRYVDVKKKISDSLSRRYQTLAKLR